MNYIEKINTLQKQVEDTKIEKAKLQEREQTLKEEKEKLLKELEVYNIKEDDLENEISRISAEIETEIKKVEDILK